MTCGIYKIQNALNGKCYVGSSIHIEENRWPEHRNDLETNWHHSIKLQRAWNKYGKEAFKFEILQECSEDQLDYLEALWMATLDSVNNGYNVARLVLEDCKVVRKQAEETKQKISQANSGRTLKPLTARHIERLVIYNTGRIFSAETLKRMSLAAFKRGQNYVLSEARQRHLKDLAKANLGRSPSQETRNKIAEAILKSNEERRLKGLPNGMKGKKHSPETIEKIRLARNSRGVSK